MKIFILDDSPVRLKTFRKNCHPSWTVVTAMTYLEAVERVKDEEFDIMFLDHDLSQVEEMQEDLNTQNSGSEFAKWLEGHYDHRNTTIIIHSFNPVGAMNMAQILNLKFKWIMYIPGAWEKIDDIIK